VSEQADIEDLERLRRGDPAAQQRFWRRYLPAVRAICADILGPGPDAADEAVNVMVDFLFRYARELSDARTAPAYVKLMAARRARKLRVRRRQAWGQVAELTEEHEDPTPLRPDDAALAAALQPRLEGCLAQLRPKAREVLILRFRSELTTEAIGGLVGGSKQYIGRLITQSLLALRTCLSRAASGATEEPS